MSLSRVPQHTVTPLQWTHLRDGVTVQHLHRSDIRSFSMNQHLQILQTPAAVSSTTHKHLQLSSFLLMWASELQRVWKGKAPPGRFVLQPGVLLISMLLLHNVLVSMMLSWHKVPVHKQVIKNGCFAAGNQTAAVTSIIWRAHPCRHSSFFFFLPVTLRLWMWRLVADFSLWK